MRNFSYEGPGRKIDQRWGYNLYIESGKLVVHVTEYHPPVLEITKEQLVSIVAEIDKEN